MQILLVHFLIAFGRICLTNLIWMPHTTSNVTHSGLENEKNTSCRVVYCIGTQKRCHRQAYVKKNCCSISHTEVRSLLIPKYQVEQLFSLSLRKSEKKNFWFLFTFRRNAFKIFSTFRYFCALVYDRQPFNRDKSFSLCISTDVNMTPAQTYRFR